MKRLTLERLWYEPERTIGRLQVGSRFVAFTMEPGNTDIEHPRVPPGFYYLEPHESSRFGSTWALVGSDVSHFAEGGIARSACIFHRGNRDEHTEGCILLGSQLGWLADEVATIGSRDAMERLRATLGDQAALLTIF